MNKLTNTLLGGVAICALASGAAVAGSAIVPPAFHVTAVHGGRVFNKTKMHNHGAVHVTYTFGIYTHVSATNLHQSVQLFSTIYRTCALADVKTRQIPNKTEYAKVGTFINGYASGCNSHGEMYYGNTYTLTNRHGKGQTDHFISILSGKYWEDDTKYSLTVNKDVTVFIE